jgi:hypothetical protein
MEMSGLCKHFGPTSVGDGGRPRVLQQEHKRALEGEPLHVYCAPLTNGALDAYNAVCEGTEFRCKIAPDVRTSDFGSGERARKISSPKKANEK